MKAVDFTLPDRLAQFGPATIEAWLVTEKAEVREGTPLVSVANEMAVLEVLSPYDGILASILSGAGETVDTDTVLATIEVTDWVHENIVSE